MTMMMIMMIMMITITMIMMNTKNLYLTLVSEGGKMSVVFRRQTYWCLYITITMMTMVRMVMVMFSEHVDGEGG